MSGKKMKKSEQVEVGEKSDSGDNQVRILGQLDRGIDEVDRLLAGTRDDIILDMSACTFITVDGLEWLEELLLRAQSMSPNIRLVNIQPTIYKVFKVAHLDCILRACGAPSVATGPMC
jgi:anti-anti-sigma regulatory factor